MSICATLDIDLIDALATAVIVLDTELRLLRINPAAQSLLAASESKLRQQPLRAVLPRADELVAAIHRALREGRSFTEHDLHLRFTGTNAITVDCRITPLWRSGSDPVYVLLEMTSVDRNPRLHSEGRMMMQNGASKALLQGLAHEIKNPLGGIRGAAQLLERELEDQKQCEYTQVIIGEVDRLRNLVDRMLGPREESIKQWINIHDVIERVRAIVSAETGPAVEIERDYDPSLPDIHADRDQLVQAFLNIVRNATQSCGACGGKVTLRTRIQHKLTIGSRVHRLALRVQVIDTGPGVVPELSDSIFFPLVSGRAEGSGLGLPIAQSLIHKQGGRIDFESEPGHTEFSVWLPIGEME